MGNIKNKVNGKTSVIASGLATGISVTNPKLLLEDQSVTSVDEVLERHQEAVSRMERNISWLAEHGGGGSGTGGGGGSDVTEATCNITVNGLESGNLVLVDLSGLQIVLNNISAKTPKLWTVIVRIGVTLILKTQASYISPTIQIGFDKILPNLINHTGNLYIGASYEDETNGIYGQASWSGNIVENVVNITTTNEAFTWETIDTALFTYKYSVGIVGAYTLGLTIFKEGVEVNLKSYLVTINSTTQLTKTISIKELLDITEETDASSMVGVYNIKAILYNNENSKVSGSCENTITIISDLILVSSTKMSIKQESPVEVSLSGSINVVFTAYLQGASTYKYSYSIGGEIIGADSIGYFGTEVNDFIPVSNKSWALEGVTLPLYVNITSGDKTATVTYWVKFVAASSTFLDIDLTSKSHMVSEFLSRNYNSGVLKFNLQYNNYENGGSTYKITSLMLVLNENSLSAITVLQSGQPYLRLSNGAYATLGKWNFNNREYTLPNLLTTKLFTISICFKADYHPDDYRSILCCGNINTNGEITTGVSIDVHGIYINNVLKANLTDNTINMVDIVCILTTKKTTIDGVEVDAIRYIIKVYLEGVLTAVEELKEFPILGDVIYLGGRIYNVVDSLGVASLKENYLCDCNIYNLLIYDTALTDFDIVINYINNKVSTLYVDGNPNFSIINSELKANFCERATDGSVISYMFKNGQYNIDFLLNGAGNLDSDKLNNYAKVLGIPIMLIDVSTDDSWTFNNFVTQQTAGNVSLPDTSGKQIQYWDPTGGNTSILKINNTTIGLQGTSTLADAVKNLNITVPNDTVFIPKNTWFPEQTYTLKADVVDSSHSNNASIGTFINEVLGYQESDGSSYFPFDPTAIDNVYNSDYKKTLLKDVTLKHTVEGFPIFLIMKFNTNTESTVSITPLGIYSFNLGRDAYRNLGFRKLNSIQDSTGDKVQITTFPYLMEGATFNETDSNANWIEIKDTTSLKDLLDVTTSLPENFDSSKGDFWLNDDNILNARYEVRFPKGKNVTDYELFKTFVSNIMLLPIEGTFSTDSLGNVTAPTITTPFNLYRLEGTSSYINTGEKLAIATDVNTLPLNLGFNQDSMYKYLSIGMLFGLIDNFGKNSTFRSWGEGQYYIDFYDLDSALGGGNQGLLDITPDVWIKYIANNIVEGKKYGYVGETFNKSKGLSGTVVSANHNKLWLSLDTQFYRAYSNNTGVNSAYTQYWYSLRYELLTRASKAGYSNFVDYFINDYYVKLVKDCGPLLFNYDYKLKYLLQFKDDSYSNTKDLTKLHGRKIAYTRDWLNKHILFLDSLYYWRDSSLVMNFLNNLNSKGSNSVYNTPEEFPMKSNTPIIMYNSVGNAVLTFYFMPTNKEVFINAGSNSSNSALNWNFTNSPNIIQFGNDEYPLSTMNINTLGYSPNNASIDANGYPAITELNLSNNKTFATGFTLSAFELGDISELRTLDFRATSGNTFLLNLNEDVGGVIYTKYRKLTKIDISNSSCIANIGIPSTPLTDLYVHNSSITTLNLKDLKYLKQVDITGCNNLSKVYISGCDSYDNFTVSNLPNLSEVVILNCPNIKTINILGCNNLTKVDIENCISLLSILINRCPSLTGSTSSNYVTISECSGLESLDLSNNLNLTTVYITKSNLSNIKTLLLNNTSIGYITGDNVDTTLLDLYSFSSLTDFAIYANPSVTKILFANNLANPIPIKTTFQLCPNLERVYGNILLTNSTYSDGWGTFRGCSKFSVHGDANNWRGTAIKNSNGVIRTPWEIITLSATNESNIYDLVTWTNGFVSGKGYTNIKFSNSSNIFSWTFYGTNVSQFDIYYLMFVLATSGVTINLSINYGFYGLRTAPFVWSTGNLPNRYMFYRCSMITSFGNAFTSSSPTFLWSPEEGKDNGLFSPLINLTSIGNIFGSSVVFSKNLFKRTTGTYPLTSFNFLGVSAVCDTDTDFSDYSNFSSDIWKATHAKLTGNLDGFFDCIPNLNYIWSTFNMYTLNFNTLVFPKKITTIGGSFNVTYATGTLDLQVIFQENTPCTLISNSFTVSDTLDLYGEKATFPITSSIFNNIRGILIIGYNPTASSGGSIISTSFRGNGLRKYINQDTFPEDIVKNCPNLLIFAGFFREVESKTFASDVKIPGNMFINNYDLLNVAALMYNCEFSFKLSGEGFRNCTNLNNVAYFCYHDLSATNRSKLTGEIPYRLFYHGLTLATVTLKGTNLEEEPDETFDLSTLLSTTYKFNNYNTKITNMERCFYGCVNLDAYNNIDNKEFVENNPSYTPYKWMYNETTLSWSLGNEPYQQEASWGYTGLPSTLNSTYKYLESSDISLVMSNTINGKTETLNYCCSPDLLRYCSTTSAVNIIGLFEDCGLNYSATSGGNQSTDESLYSVGMQGRIPPYLLKPVSNVQNILALFKNCRKLSSYKTSAGNIYQIPKNFFTYAPKVSILSKAFQGLSYIYGTSLNVFDVLTLALDIRCIFAISLYGADASGGTNTLSGIFSNNIVNKASGAFSGNDLSLSDNILGVAETNIYANVGIANIKATNNFNIAKLPSSSNIGYVYYKWGSNANDAAIANQNNNYN